ncbi:MAG: hypothetical protein P4L42_01635 [Desulfocapsaceae bacterium]|nr:hypothetical protein [Desulfocapsaceae bacterium]
MNDPVAGDHGGPQKVGCSRDDLPVEGMERSSMSSKTSTTRSEKTKASGTESTAVIGFPRGFSGLFSRLGVYGAGCCAA